MKHNWEENRNGTGTKDASGWRYKDTILDDDFS